MLRKDGTIAGGAETGITGSGVPRVRRSADEAKRTVWGVLGMWEFSKVSVYEEGVGEEGR